MKRLLLILFSFILLCVGCSKLFLGSEELSLNPLAPGAHDTSFNTAGWYEVFAIAQQNDGKLLVGGNEYFVYPDSYNGIARINADGTLDKSFNQGGLGTDYSSLVKAIILQGNGKVLIGGQFAQYDGTNVGRVARLNSDGSLDTSFNANQAVSSGVVNAMALQSDGGVIAGGNFTNSKYLTRLNADGSVDTNFNIAGSGVNGTVNVVIVLQSSAKILIGGSFTKYNSISCGSIARLNADGSLDTTFNTSGAGVSGTVNTLFLQADGKILLGGSFGGYDGVTRSGVARLNADGSLDTSFGSTGAGAAGGEVRTVAVQGDGKILLGGAFTTYTGATVDTLVRLGADGGLDAEFNSAYGTSVNTVAVQSNGMILVGGTTLDRLWY